MNLKYLLFFILLVLFSLTLVSAGIFQKSKTCGDGTLEGECSINQPYFCSERILIEKASICGCPNITEINRDKCFSKYQTTPKEISLDYILKGKQNHLNFTVYEGLTTYLSKSPKFISYSEGEEASRADFKLRNINEENQRILLIPLVIEIQNLADNKKDQARIAISLVQHIPFGSSDKIISVGNNTINYSRYPYEVLYDQEGICASKSELLVFLLRELGYETIFFYHDLENHDSVGIKCPEKYSLRETGYCFIETTGPSILTDNENAYLEGIKLTSSPEVMFVSAGDSFEKMYEYRDARIFKKIRKKIEEKGKINLFRNFQLERIKNKYGLK